MEFLVWTTIAARAAGALFCVVAWIGLVVGGAAAQQEVSLGPAEGETLEAWTLRWMDGPVKFIATDEEQSLFAELDTTQERIQFIRLFWQRRDPRLRGPENEFLQEFEERIEYANENFGNGKPGWETVFGQVVLVLGPPDRTRREMGMGPGFSDRPPILWSYDRLIPDWPANESLLFVFRWGRWRLLPPNDDFGGVDEMRREMERQSTFVEMPTDMEIAMRGVVNETLIRPVDYRAAIDEVRATVAFPDAQIPFGWDADFAAGQGGSTTVTLSFSWRMGSLVFHAVEGTFQTEMVVRAVLLDASDEPVTETSEHISVEIPIEDLEARADEIVERSIELQAPAGSYTLELILEDQLLGYRTVYREPLDVPSG
jgi:GWxTD domain-containing protein